MNLFVAEDVARAHNHVLSSLARALAPLLECRKRRLDPATLAFGDQVGQYFAELRMLCSRVDVLPAVRLEESVFDFSFLGVIHRAAARWGEVVCIRLGLGLEDAVNGRDKLDELANCPVAFLFRKLSVVPHPLKFVEDRVLAFLTPVIEKHVLKQLGQFTVGIYALAIMKLCEQLDVESQAEYRPGAFSKHGAGDAVRIDVEAIADGRTSPIIASIRRKSAWCFNSSSLKRTNASSATWSPNQ